MKSTSEALAAHLAGPVTTLATCWRITGVDGREFFFIDHDRDLSFDGNPKSVTSILRLRRSPGLGERCGLGIDFGKSP